MGASNKPSRPLGCNGFGQKGMENGFGDNDGFCGDFLGGILLLDLGQVLDL